MKTLSTILFITGFLFIYQYSQAQTSVIGGSILTLNAEGDIQNGGDEIFIKLDGVTWALQLGGDNSATEALINSFTGSVGGEWDQVTAALDYTMVKRLSNVEAVISLPPVPGYNIFADETVKLVVDRQALLLSLNDAPATNQILIKHDPVAIGLGGTVASGLQDTETDIRSGLSTIELEVKNDIWSADLGEDNAVSQALIDGITGDQAWATVHDALSFNNIIRVSDSLIRINIPAVTDYFLNADENVSILVPAVCFANTANDINVAGFSISNELPIITLTGTIQDQTRNSEADIRTGGLSTIQFNLSGDQWNPLIGTDLTVTQSLIDGISNSIGTVWNAQVKPLITASDLVYNNPQLITLTVPAVPLFDILANESILVSVPAECLVVTVTGSISATPVLQIRALAEANINDPGLSEYTLSGSPITLSLTADVFNTVSLTPASFTLNGTTAITISGVSYVSPAVANISLSRNIDFDEDQLISLTVAGSVLSGGNPLTTNSIAISSVIEPVVNAVVIPEGAYGIGDEVRVDISVNNDGGISYTYFSGTVAGKTLNNVTRQTNSLYYGYFTVIAGDQDYPSGASIPVVNLRFNQGTVPGEAFNGNIVQSDLIIDAHRPVISGMTVSNGVKKIGDLVEVIVIADGNNYTAVNSLTNINGIPVTASNVNFVATPTGGLLQYTVQNGDTDVSTGNLQLSIVLEDEAGNRSLPATALAANSLSIDANPPVVTSISVQNKVYSIGDIVPVDVIADGANYTAVGTSLINGFTESGPYVDFINLGSNAYRFRYTVKANDPEVNPGELEVSVILRDAAGNTGSAYTTVQTNQLAVYTVLPTANLFGNQQICEDDSARLTVNLTGRAPWKIYLNNGSGNSEISDINTSPFEYYVKPDISTTYKIDSVVDVNGLKKSGTGTAFVKVNMKTDIQIINLNSSYSVEAPPFKLQANVGGSPYNGSNGVFTGPGVVSSTSFFYPQIADTINSPHTIYYTYTNSNGCVSVDSALVFILGAVGDIFIPKPVYCTYNSPFTVSASNSAGSIGSFTLLNNLEQPVSGLTDNNNNTASINPALLSPGNYIVLYVYVQDGASLSIREGFAIESVRQPKIITLNKSEYCHNEPSFALEGDIQTAVFSGPGVTGNISTGFKFNPSLTEIGSNTVTYTNTSLNGCVSAVSKTVKINFAPTVNFTISDVCMSPTDSIYFTNTTVNKSEVNSWKWNFGDINSGASNISSKESDYHFFSKAGSRKILLVGTTVNSCIDSLERVVDFGNKPTGDFTWSTDCFVPGDSIKFQYDPREVPVVSYAWKFFTSEANFTERNKGPFVYYTYNDTSEYKIELTTTTSIGCSKTISKRINLKPTIIVDETPYFEDFNVNDGKWTSGKEANSAYNSWTYGLVNFNGIGSNASKGWHTVLPQSEMPEKSWLISPCFDLRELDRPMIKLNYLQSLEAKREGAVLQTSVDDGKTWRNVGELEDGINWYNSYQIISKPGGQDIGWTGKLPFNPDKKWVEARHSLENDLTKVKNLRFRIAFASGNSSTEAREGFAVDNIWIGSKSRKVLLEHFTNVSETDSKAANGIVNYIFTRNYDDLIKLEYHTAFPGNDPMNTDNRAVPATRSLFYGISNVPYSVMDGGGNGNLRFDYLSSQPKEVDANIQSLTDPGFDIKINTTAGINNITTEVILTALKNFEPQERILQIAVYEKIIEGLNVPSGEASFLHVVKTMLPNAAGTAFFDGWTKGEVRSFEYSWDYTNVYDPTMVRIAAFVQNDITNEIYQSATNDSVNITTARKESSFENLDFMVYPNPAEDEINLLMRSPETGVLQILLFDQTGRLILNEPWDMWEKIKVLNVQSLNAGIYFLRLNDRQGKIMGTRKLITTGGL